MQKETKKISLNKFLKPTLLISIVLFFVIFLSLIILKNIFSYQLIEKKLNEFLGLKIEFINPNTNFDFKLNIISKADSIKIYDKNKTTTYISINEPKIIFKPFSLIFKKGYIKNLDAKDITINISRDTQGKIDILNQIPLQNWSFLEKNNLSLTRLNSKIDYFEFNFIDNYKIKSKTSLKINQNEINIIKKDKKFNFKTNGIIETNLNNKKQIASINANISSKYPFNKLNSNDINFNIILKDLNLFTFSDLAKLYISKDIKNLEGKIDASIKTDKNNHILNIKTSNLALNLNNNKKIIPYKHNVLISSLFNINKNQLKINDFTILSNDLNINSEGEILKPFSKNPNINLQTKITNTQLNNLLYLIPDNAIFYRPKGIPALKKANFYGLINGKTNLKLFPLDITGDLKITNIHIPGYPRPFKNNDANINFIKDKMRLHTRVYTPNGEYVTVEGISNLDNSLYGKYDIKSTKKIDLSFAKLYLVPIQQIIGFNIGPVPIMDIEGYGNIDIKTQGTISDAQIFGEFEAYNASTTLQGLKGKLTNGNCKLIFDNRNLFFKEIKGKLNNANFLLTGTGNTKGEIKLNIKLKDAKTSEILDTLNNSVFSKPYSGLFKNISATSGNLEADIDLIGTIKDYENENLLNDLMPSGRVEIKNNKIILKNGLGTKNITGILNFGEKQTGIFESYINNSKINISFNINDNLKKIANGEDFNFKSNILSNKIEFKDIMDEFKKATFLNKSFSNSLNNIQDETNFYFKTNINSEGKLSLNNFNLDNIKNDGYIIGLNSQNIKNIKFNSGLIKLSNQDLIFDNFSNSISNGKLEINGNIHKFLSKKPIGNLKIYLDNINLKPLNGLFLNINTTESILNEGIITFKGNDIKLQSLSLTHDSMPIFINSTIKDIYNTQQFQTNLSTILNESTTDSIINSYLTYPIKIKGEIPIKASFKGTIENYNIDLSATMPQYSDISFSGANLGDINHKREITGKISVNNNVATLSNLKLIKYILNQNNKLNPLIMAKIDGKIIQKNDSIFYDNFKITTNSPINVRVLNLIFKKSLLKKGNFECNLNLNDNIKNPKIFGKINLQDLDIPLYDTQINNINVNLNNKFMDGIILAKTKQSDLNIHFSAQNKFEAPYIINNINISSNNFDIPDILDNLTPAPQKTDISIKQELPIKPSDIIVKNGSFVFKDVQYEKINAQNLKGNFNFENNIFNLKNTSINIAQGNLIAKGDYNLKTTKLNMEATMQDCDSNSLAKDFLKLQDQIFGKLNGTITLNVKNLNSPEAIKNLNSNILFSVNNGKMPKLGSLEHLLRAGNLFRNGLLGLSLNNIIEVLTPYKTGEFEKIEGRFAISKGNIENLEIKSKGKNLSMFLNGNYNIIENDADIKIYGKLSQNISNALGAVGNATIGQFINSISVKKIKKDENIELYENLLKIPDVESQNNDARYFSVKVTGDINKENYIKNFSWL